LYDLIIEEGQKKKFKQIINGVKDQDIRKLKTGLTEVGVQDANDRSFDENSNYCCNLIYWF
jgi:hypothetical protein